MELLDQLYRQHKTKRGVKIAYVDRSADVSFSLIAYTAAAQDPDSREIEDFTQSVWIGYLIAVDADRKILKSIWK